jgi:sulfite exporter TauE/SafE
VIDQALVFSALLMGLAGTPHCAVMCGAACGALTRRQRASWAFHGARVLGYAIAGAVAASSVSVIARFGQSTAALRPLWTLVHVAALALGMWLVATGRQPGWMERAGQRGSVSAELQVISGPNAGVFRGAAIGLAWAAWPCGLLQSALMVAALANSAWFGALAMAAFATASLPGLLLAPTLWRRLAARDKDGQRWSRFAVRAAGAMLAGASLWALGHETLMRVAAWCGVA